MEAARAQGEVAAEELVESVNPLDGRRLGAVAATPPERVQGVVDEACAVQPFWAQLPLSDRARYMRRTAQVILDNLEPLGELLAREQGKPRAEAYVMELLPTIDALYWLAREGSRLLHDEELSLPLFLAGKSARTTLEPLGAVGVIAPWNYPWSIPFQEVAMALMAGNGVVLKPAPLTPLTGERIRWVFERAGVPEGVVRTVHGGPEVGAALVRSSVAKVFFTGSVEAGRDVGIASAERLKRSVLELGGKDPMLVLDDAPLANAVSGALWGGFANAGQTCSGIERVYVIRQLADRFVEELVGGARALRLGDPLDWDTQVGPMVWDRQFEKVRDLVEDAVARGATLHCGGPRLLEGYPHASFYAPAVLTGVRPEMRIMREEIFGPVLPVVTVDSEDEAIDMANDSEFGLGASVWTADRSRGERFARRLRAGMVWVNDHMYSHGAIVCPWGGVKSSGVGRTHSKFGLWECTEAKLVTWEPSRFRNFWWYPYDEALGRTLEAAARILYGRDADKAPALRRGALPLLKVARRTMREAFRR